MSPRWHPNQPDDYARQAEVAVDDLADDGVPRYPRAWYPAMVLLGQCLGVFPLRLKKAPAGQVRRAWRLSRYLFVPNVAMMVCAARTLYTFAFLVDFSFLNSNPLKMATTRAALTLYSLSSLPCLLGPWLFRRRLEHFVNSLLLLSRELRPADQRVWPAGWSARALLAPMLILALDATREYLHNVGSTQPAVVVTSVVLAYCVPVALETQYVLCCRVLALGFHRLADHVSALQGPPRSPSVHWLEEARRCHEQLLRLTDSLHSMLGLQLLVTVLACLVNLVNCAYVLAAALLMLGAQGGLERGGPRGDFSYVESAFADFAYFVTRLYSVCAAAEAVKKAAMAVAMQTLRVDPGTWQPSSKAKWFLFQQQVETLSPQCTAAGLLNVGADAFSAMSASGLTYLLILLQFDAANI